MLLHTVYQDVGKADAAVSRSIQKHGIQKTLSLIDKTPTSFGKLKGRCFLGSNSPERKNALAMVKEFKFAVEKEYLLRVEYNQAKKLDTLEKMRNREDFENETTRS